ncbi:hypothetical protein HK101_009741 [Irineochytrium annulatum]|nr:hypothetical protein HK101_009741 [Irineochytrium annulatum]
MTSQFLRSEKPATAPDAGVDNPVKGVDPDDDVPSPEERANYASQIIFQWMDTLLWRGFKKPLQLDDLYPLGNRFKAKALAEDFELRWTTAVEEYHLRRKTDKMAKKPNLIRLLVRMFGSRFLPIGMIKFSTDVANIFSPLLLKYFITFVTNSVGSPENAPPASVGYWLAVGLLLLNMYSSIGIGYYFQRAGGYGMMLRATLTGAVYRKSLRLSGKSRQEFNAGRITNMISTDLVRLDLFVTLFHLTWTFPFQYTKLLTSLSVQAYIIKRLVALRKTNATTTDARVKLTGEIFAGIRIIKFFGWEDSFLERIADIRKKELKVVVTASLIRSATTAFGFGIPVLAAATTFMVFYNVNPAGFTPVVIFTALSWFNQLRNPIMWTPTVISAFADAAVGIKRMQALLEAEENQFEPTYDTSLDPAVVIENGTFSWESAEDPNDPATSVAPLPEVSHATILDDAASVRSHAAEQVDAISSIIAPYAASANSVLTPDALATSADLVGKSMDAERSPMVDPAHKDFGRLEDDEEDDIEMQPGATGPRYSRPTLEEIAFTVPRGSLVAVVGAVGAGKSSLLSAMIGGLKAHERRGKSPKVVFGGSVGYVSQQAWIMNSTLRENVLFGLPFDEKRYAAAVDVVSLRKDLAVLPGGDDAEIGEKGINLSGGQKQRVSLARLVYQDCEIVLMDDCLSAVDAQVGREIFENCICGALKTKTRILVTHQLHFVPQCDIIISMKDGRIEEIGSYATLMAKEAGVFAQLMRSYGGIAEGGNSEESADEVEVDAIVQKKTEEVVDAVKGKQLMKAEERQVGTLEKKVFVTFSIAMGGILFLLLLLFTLTMTQVTRVGNDLWLVYWTSQSIPGLSGIAYLWIYLAFGLSQALTLLIFSALVSIGGFRAARNLHLEALNRIAHAPSMFFDTNPLGRILNRFSRDQDIVDNTLPDAVRLFAITFATCIATFGLVLYATKGFFIFGLIPLMAVYYLAQNLYRTTARELKRLDALTRSPLYAHISESMSGTQTLIAYNATTRFIAKTDALINLNNRPYYLQITSQRWLGMRLETIGNLLVFITCVLFVSSRFSQDPALVGLALSYALQVTQLLSLCIRQYTEAEVQLVSIERLHFYASEVGVEALPVVEGSRPPKVWPSEGRVAFEGVSMRYQEDLPLVLNEVSFSVAPCEKIGVVGRTGSGKSSLMLALFRMVEPSNGRVVIDGVDLSKIGLKDLRSRLAIIPQDPILFSGTIRSNLDPFSEHQELQLWEALSKAGMKKAVTDMEGGLDAEVSPGGENLSVGQRQLLCMARAILKDPRIIVLDECTANVDMETDALIQRMIREELKNTTTFTIAHRLNTIIDSDRVLVLDQGKVIDFDTPANLLAKEGSIFASMIEETGASNAAALKLLANQVVVKQ